LLPNKKIFVFLLFYVLTWISLSPFGSFALNLIQNISLTHLFGIIHFYSNSRDLNCHNSNILNNPHFVKIILYSNRPNSVQFFNILFESFIFVRTIMIVVIRTVCTSSICLDHTFHSNNSDSNCRNSNSRNSNSLTHSHLVWIIYFYSTFFMTNSEDTNVDTICIWNLSFLPSILLTLKNGFYIKNVTSEMKQNFLVAKYQLDAFKPILNLFTDYITSNKTFKIKSL
jgi:hypothetical protein